MAPLVAVLAGRRVLRAPTLGKTSDDDSRWLAETRILKAHRWTRLAARYGVGYVVLSPGGVLSTDVQRAELHGPEDLEGRPGFLLVYADRLRFRVYQLAPEAAGADNAAQP
jgi:hypothetical protein